MAKASSPAGTAGAGQPGEPPDSADGVGRCLAMLVNEAARCLAERIVDRPLYLDLALLLGIGFPDHRGGVLRYADQYGLPAAGGTDGGVAGAVAASGSGPAPS